MYRFPNREAARFLGKWIVFNKRACNGPKEDTTVARQKSQTERRKKNDKSHFKTEKSIKSRFNENREKSHSCGKICQIYFANHIQGRRNTIPQNVL